MSINFTEIVARHPDAFDACRDCEIIGDYCGGSGHYSCGCFRRPHPSAIEADPVPAFTRETRDGVPGLLSHKGEWQALPA